LVIRPSAAFIVPKMDFIIYLGEILKLVLTRFLVFGSNENIFFPLNLRV
jgi:hypothetical protein